jgi:lipoprotein-anchoring transpeptidase ErfK/SrfK
MDEDFLIALNPDAAFAEGETISVVDPGEPLDRDVKYIRVLKRLSRLSAYDTAGRLVADYPVTIGSDTMPSPEGIVRVIAIAHDPTYHYDPEVNFQQGENTDPLILPPGPNGPVGSVWIDLSRPTYGIHGTPEPSVLFQKSSHGCVRLTNWDAQELAATVREGTVVEFVE